MIRTVLLCLIYGASMLFLLFDAILKRIQMIRFIFLYIIYFLLILKFTITLLQISPRLS